MPTLKVTKLETRRSRHWKGFLVFGCIGLLIGLIYFSLQAYDTHFSKADGLINRYAYRNIIRLTATSWLVSFLLYLGLSSRRKIIQNTALSLSTTAVLLLLLEAVAHILIGMGTFGRISIEFRRYHISVAIADPNREPLFWGGFSEQTGRWQAANARYSALYGSGDSVFRHTNSVGASDRERAVQKSSPDQKRVITLGDSFMEGMLVNDRDRAGVEPLRNRHGSGTFEFRRQRQQSHQLLFSLQKHCQAV